MTTNKIKTWELTLQKGAVELDLPDMSNLDAITRQLPQGFYTTFRTYGGGKRVLGLHTHLQRLYGPAAEGHIDPSVPEKELRDTVSRLLRAYEHEARVRLVMAASGQIYLAIEPLKPLSPEVYSRGVTVITTGVERQNPRLKSTSFISTSQGARNQIAGSHIFEALLTKNGAILEGMTSNFFYIKDGKLGTARDEVLLGVTRRTVLRVARGCGLEIVYKPLKRDQITAIDEAFLTSSSRGIVPIVQIDDVTAGEGRPGPMTKQLITAYDEYVLRTAEKI